jgi:hypothetical protein
MFDEVCIYNRMHLQPYNGGAHGMMKHFRLDLRRFEEGLKLRLKKYFLGLQEMEYLGCTVSGGHLSVSTKKVEAINEWPVPMT